MRNISLSLIFCVLSTGTESQSAEKLHSVALRKLARSSSDYQGKRIVTVGRMDLDFESDKLSGIICSPVKSDGSRPLWLDVSKIEKHVTDTRNHSNVRITGKVDSKNKGHMGEYAGTIVVERIESIDERAAAEACRP